MSHIAPCFEAATLAALRICADCKHVLTSRMILLPSPVFYLCPPPSPFSTSTTSVRVVRNPQDFMAQELYNTMKGPGTRDRNLIRIIVMHAEEDLKDIGDAFFEVGTVVAVVVAREVRWGCWKQETWRGGR